MGKDNAITLSESNMAEALGYSCLYYICREDDKDGLCKVGYSKNAVRRLHGFQPHIPERVIIVNAVFVRTGLSAIEKLEADRILGVVEEQCLELFGEDRRRIMEPYCEIMESVENIAVSIKKFESRVHRHYKEMGAQVRGEWFAGGHKMLAREAIRILNSEHQGAEYMALPEMRRKVKSLKDEAALAA